MTDPYVKQIIENEVAYIEFYHPIHNSLPGNILLELVEVITNAGENDQILAYERFERIFHRECVFVMGKGQARSLSFFKFCVGGLISLGCRTPKVEICLVDQRRFRARFKVYLSGRNVVTPDRLMTIDDAGKVIRNEPYAEDAKCPFVKSLNIVAKA